MQLQHHPLETRTIERFRQGRWQTLDDSIACEQPLEIRMVQPATSLSQPVAVTMRTPGEDEELAAGFCLTEGIIDSADEIERIFPCLEADYGNVVNVQLTAEAAKRRQASVRRSQRDFYMSSSCGLCGKQTIDRIEQRVGPVDCALTVPMQVLMELPGHLLNAQATFAQTGALHAAAVFTAEGELIALREDVGRHNATDKAIGHLLLHATLPMRDCLLLVSGRSSFEILQKAAMAGIGIVAAIGAPSSLAIDFAQRMQQTLIGFLAADRMNVYSHGGRVQR